MFHQQTAPHHLTPDQDKSRGVQLTADKVLIFSIHTVLNCFKMVEDMNKFLHSMLSKVDGLYSILITDRDGVPVLKVATEDAPEKALRTSFLTTFGIATDQGGKLGLGKTKSVICLYDNFQVIQMNKLPLVVTFVTRNDCNTGHVLALESQLDSLLPILRSTVGDT